MLYVNPVGPMLNIQAAGDVRRKAALQEFEQIVLNSLLREMRQTTNATGVKKAREMQLFEEMLDEALSTEMARSGQVGFAAQIERQLAAQPGAQPADI